MNGIKLIFKMVFNFRDGSFCCINIAQCSDTTSELLNLLTYKLLSSFRAVSAGCNPASKLFSAVEFNQSNCVQDYSHSK